MADEPHAPAKADTGEVVEEFPLAVDVDPVEVELPAAAPPVPDGDVGPDSVFSNAQPVASVDASSKQTREIIFMMDTYSFVTTQQFWHAS